MAPAFGLAKTQLSLTIPSTASLWRWSCWHRRRMRMQRQFAELPVLVIGRVYYPTISIGLVGTLTTILL